MDFARHFHNRHLLETTRILLAFLPVFKFNLNMPLRVLEKLLIPVWKGKLKTVDTVESCYSQKNDIFLQLS